MHSWNPIFLQVHKNFCLCIYQLSVCRYWIFAHSFWQNISVRFYRGKYSRYNCWISSSLLDLLLALVLVLLSKLKTQKDVDISQSTKLPALCLGWIICWKLNLFHILKYSAASKSSRVDSPPGLCHFPFIVFSKLKNDFLLANLPILWCYNLSSSCYNWPCDCFFSLILSLGGHPCFARFGVVTQSFYFVFLF